MGRIVAISSGDLKSTERINQYIIDLAGGKGRNMLFIGTASNDNTGYRERFAATFGNLGCTVEALCLTLREYSDDEINQMIEWADMIYVGGGDTFSMMKCWRKYGLDKKLRKVYEEDSAVLSGISAGAICWFRCGHSDSEVFWSDGEVNYGWVDELLDIYPYAFCPHYEERKEIFPEMLRQKNLVGLAMESDTAFVDCRGEICYMKCNPSAKAYLMQYREGRLLTECLEIKQI